VCVCVYVWVCVVSLTALRLRFPVFSGVLVVSLYAKHEADILGRTADNFLDCGTQHVRPLNEVTVTAESVRIE
jgi:hypothetical protein